MTERPDFSPISLLHTLWMRKFAVLAIWAVATVVAAVFVQRIPAVYKAEAVILVESQRIPEKYVSSTVSADLQERLNTVSQQILSSRQLITIIEKFDLYPEARRARSQEEVIQQMRDDVGISIESRWRKDRPEAFRISYTGPSPAVVAQVTNYIGGLFIDGNIRSRESQAEGTSEFLEQQLAQAKARLEEQEARLSEYKLRYHGELPEQGSTLATALGQFQVELQGVQESISRAEQQKLILQSGLEGARTSLEALSRGRSEALGESGSTASGGKNGDMKESDRIRAELEALRTRYTESHPDIKLAEAELARALRAEQMGVPAKSPATGTATGSGRPAGDGGDRLQIEQALNRERERVESLQAQIAATSKQLESLELEREQIKQSIAAYEARLERLPLREQQLAGVSRDYEISKATYRSLLDKKLAASEAADMERHQQPERFTMLEGAKTPERPLRPDRRLLNVLGSLLGLFLGVTFAVALQVKQNVLLGEWELPPATWILGRVPVINPTGSDPERSEGRDFSKKSRKEAPKLKWLLGVSTLLVLGIIAAGVYLGWV